MCPSCGVANRTALPEGSEEEARDTKITKEMEDIVSQMAIKVISHVHVINDTYMYMYICSYSFYIATLVGIHACKFFKIIIFVSVSRRG